MFGHQTMIDGVWSPSISRLSRAFKTVKTASPFCPAKTPINLGHFLKSQPKKNLCSTQMKQELTCLYAAVIIKTFYSQTDILPGNRVSHSEGYKLSISPTLKFTTVIVLL